METIDTPYQPDEPVYTPTELAKAKKLHPDTIRRMFRHEAGVIRIGHPRGRRQRFLLRIPASVVARVFAARTIKAA